MNKKQLPEPSKGPRTPKRDSPIKGPRDPKPPRKPIPKVGAYRKRHAADEAEFQRVVRERDEVCQGKYFFAWLSDMHPEQAAAFFSFDWGTDGTLDVHHVLQKSLFREFAFTPENGVLVRRWIHSAWHTLGWEELVEDWWLNAAHPDFREVLGVWE